MTGKEKIIQAFSKEGTPEFPVVICYEGIFIRDHWSQLTNQPWYAVYSPDIQSQVQWNMDVIKKINQDWFVVYPFYSRKQRKHIRIEPGENKIVFIDAYNNVKKEIEKPKIAGWNVAGKAQSAKIKELPQTISDLEKLLPEKPPEFDKEKFLNEGHHDLAEQLIKIFPDKMPICHVTSPLWKLYGIFGFEGMMLLIATEPELVDYACERFCEISIFNAQQYIACGAQVLWIEECLTDMISSSAFERFNVPYMKKLVDAIRNAGGKSIYYYCGNPWEKLDKILQIGADAISFEEGKKNFDIDIEKLVEIFNGRCTVLGNLDAINVLPYADENRLRKEIERQLLAGVKNKRRFIMSTGSPVTPGTSVERVQLYCEITREIGAKL